MLMNNEQCVSFPLVYRATSSLLTLNVFQYFVNKRLHFCAF